MILIGAIVIVPSGWEKEDTMDAIASYEGEEMTYCEEGVCVFATEDKANPEDPQSFSYNDEDFGEP